MDIRRVLRSIGCVCVTAALWSCTSVRDRSGHSLSSLTQERGRYERILAAKNAGEIVESDMDQGDKTAEGMLARGDVLRDQNKLAEAVWSYVQAIELDPDSTEPAERIAYLHLREDPDKAESIFRSLIRSGASDASTVVGLGLAQLSQGQVHEAVKSLEESVAKEPDSARALESLGVAYNLIGRHDLARERLTQALQLRPGSSLIANNLGMSELMLRNLDAAEARFRLAMLLAPENVVAQNNLGLTLGLMGATEEAYDIFLLVGAEQSAHNNLGYVYLLSGDSEMALHHFEAALLAGGPDSLTILKNLSALDR